MPVEKVTKPEQSIVSMTTLLDRSDIPQYIGETIVTLTDFLHQQPATTTTTPFVSYYDLTDEGKLDTIVKVEVGFGISELLPPTEMIDCYLLPSHQAVRTLHVGDYDGLTPLYKKLLCKIQQENGTFLKRSFEYYLTDETIPIYKQETMIELIYR